LEKNVSNPGFCLNCSAQVTGIEPDARNYTCEECEAKEVFGAEEVLLMGAFFLLRAGKRK
jgi:hypothetical protein